MTFVRLAVLQQRVWKAELMQPFPCTDTLLVRIINPLTSSLLRRMSLKVAWRQIPICGLSHLESGLQILRPTGAGRQLILMMKWAWCKKHTAYSIYSFISPLFRETGSIMREQHCKSDEEPTLSLGVMEVIRSGWQLQARDHRTSHATRVPLLQS